MAQLAETLGRPTKHQAPTSKRMPKIILTERDDITGQGPQSKTGAAIEDVFTKHVDPLKRAMLIKVGRIFPQK